MHVLPQFGLKPRNPPASKPLMQSYLFTVEPPFFISLTILSKSNAASQGIGCPSQAINISRLNNTNGPQMHSLSCSKTLYSPN